jgi:ABC-2 type transport system permease protein
VSVVLLAFFNLCLNLVVVTIFTLAAGVHPMLTWLEVPLIVGLLVLLSAGLAMLLSSLFVYLRDVEPIWEVLSQVIFYASPVIIPVTVVQKSLSPTWLHIYMLNPLAVVFQQFRHAFITHATPSVGALLGSKAAVAIPVAIVLAILVLGFWVFNRIAPHVAEDL